MVEGHRIHREVIISSCSRRRPVSTGGVPQRSRPPSEWTPRGDELLKALEGKDIDEVLASGEQLLVSAGSVAATGVQAQEADKMQEDEQEQEGDVSEDADVDIGGFMEDDY